jgi:membrane associated rhomboid family serine protease
VVSQSNPPILNAPKAVSWIVGITVVVHLLRFLMPRGLSEWMLETFAFIPLRYEIPANGAADLFSEFVSPVSHLLLHADWMHVIVNMAFLLAFGSAIGRRMGAIQFIILYLLCGIAACFFWDFLNPTSQAILVGASGAVSGMVGAAARVSIWPPRHSGSALPFWRTSTIITFVAIWLALNVVFGLFPQLITGEYGGIAWEAHLGGFIVGFLLIGLFDGRGRIEPVFTPVRYH